MKWGLLNEYFLGVAWKRLSAHEVDPATSRGHEFQGVEALKDLLGISERRTFATTYMILSDDDPIVSVGSTGEWYDSRENQPHRAPEWRLYYPAAVDQIQVKMRAGDLLVIALTKDSKLVILLAPRDSTREAQLRVLFALRETEHEPMQSQKFGSDAAIGFVATEILEELGLAAPASESRGDGATVIAMAEELSRVYPRSLPRGKEVSGLVQSRLADVDPILDPDGTLVRWIEAEEALFRRWEDGLIERRLKDGFMSPAGETDVQAFRDFSMSIRQSRVSRAGGALQLHTSRILVANGIEFDAQATTENGERPDFLFPGERSYHDSLYPPAQLRMLAVKFTAKDRWRQVLNEAVRIERKHLLTLEATISLPQLKAIESAKLQLVLPQPYLDLYPAPTRTSLNSLKDFLGELRAAARLRI
jgi:hypothetical protein